MTDDKNTEAPTQLGILPADVRERLIAAGVAGIGKGLEAASAKFDGEIPGDAMREVVEAGLRMTLQAAETLIGSIVKPPAPRARVLTIDDARADSGRLSDQQRGLATARRNARK